MQIYVFKNWYKLNWNQRSNKKIKLFANMRMINHIKIACKY